MTSDLVTFLRARLDEDERIARHAFGQHNNDGPEWTEVTSGALSTGYELHGIGDSAITRHMERWDPKRVLAEVDAKRLIVDWAGQAAEAYETDTYDTQRATKALTLDSVLLLLALPYATHPDYRPEWAP